MRIPFALLFLVLGLSSAFLYAENRIIIFGGHDYNQVNMFRDGMADHAAAFKKHGWKVQVLYDGPTGRCTVPSTHAICKSKASLPACCPVGIDPKDATVGPIARAADVSASRIPLATRDGLLLDLDRALHELTSGSQLLLHISEHGNRDGTIEIDNDNVLSYSDPEVLKRLEKLRKKGVHLGFAVGSCFSGTAIKPLKKYGCVISASSAVQTSTVAMRGESSDPAHRPLMSQGPFDATITEILNKDGSSRALSLHDWHEASLMKQAGECMDDDPQSSAFVLPSSDALVGRDVGRLVSGVASCHPDGALPLSAQEIAQFEAHIDLFRAVAVPYTTRGWGIEQKSMRRDFALDPRSLVAAEEKAKIARENWDRWVKEQDRNPLPVAIRLENPLGEFASILPSILKKELAQNGDARVDGTVVHLEISLASLVEDLSYDSWLLKHDMNNRAKRVAASLLKAVPTSKADPKVLQENLSKALVDAYNEIRFKPKVLAATAAREDLRAKQDETYDRQHSMKCGLPYLRARLFAAERLKHQASDVKMADFQACEDFKLTFPAKR